MTGGGWGHGARKVRGGATGGRSQKATRRSSSPVPIPKDSVAAIVGTRPTHSHQSVIALGE